MLTIATAQANAVLAVDVGVRVDVTGLPASGPSTSLSLFVEGLDETVTPDTWVVKLATSPASYTAAWVLDSPTYSQLDSTTILTL